MPTNPAPCHIRPPLIQRGHARDNVQQPWSREAHGRAVPHTFSVDVLRHMGVAKGKPFVLQPDDSFDDYTYGQERTQSNPQALPRAERRAVAAIYERTRTGGKVFLNRVAQVQFLSRPPAIFPEKKRCQAHLTWHRFRVFHYNDANSDANVRAP